MLGEDAQWGAAATQLGLVLHDPARAGIGFHGGAAFSHLERARGPVARTASSTHWMYGKRRTGGRGSVPRDVDVMVLVNLVSHGSSTTTYTHAIARIDPPLFLGLNVARHGWLQRKLSPPVNPFGDPRIDDVLRMDARDPTRAMVLLTSRGGPAPALAQRLATLEGVDFLLADGVVDIHTSSGVVTDAALLAARLDYAAAMAVAIADQEAWLPADPTRGALEGVWRTFAEADRFALDPARMRIGGEVSGARVAIALESEPTALFTAVTVELPRRLGLGLRMKPQGPMQFLRTFFGGQDIEVGDLAFDDRFVIEGKVPAHVQAAFANPELRRAILELAHGAQSVFIDDAVLFFRYPIPATTEAQLRGIVERIRIALHGFFPQAPADGPYR